MTRARIGPAGAAASGAGRGLGGVDFDDLRAATGAVGTDKPLDFECPGALFCENFSRKEIIFLVYLSQPNARSIKTITMQNTANIAP